MNADTVIHQRLSRLTPVADVLAAIARVNPVAPCRRSLAEALGCVLAADIVAEEALPSAPVALRDGWAVASETTRDAGPYAPSELQPPDRRVDAFDVLPPGTDAVAPLDAVSSLGGTKQIMVPVAPGEGVLPAGGNANPGTALCRAGYRLRMSDLASLAAAGVSEVTVRQPRIRIVNTKAKDAILDATAAMIAHAVATGGAMTDMASDLDAALRSDEADAIIAVGGTGSGRNDRSVIALARAGSVTCHGIALSPGETAAFGTASGRPVLLVPGRVDAALACWLVLGRELARRLTGARDDDLRVRATLARKVTSTIGLAEVIPVRRDGDSRDGDSVGPLAAGYLPLQSLARADGWVLVPPESEGYPAGTEIEMRPLP